MDQIELINNDHLTAQEKADLHKDDSSDYGKALTYLMFSQDEYNEMMQSEFERWASDKLLNIEADDSKRYRATKGPDGKYQDINPYKDSITRLAYDVWSASREHDEAFQKIDKERLRLSLREKEDPTCIESIMQWLQKEPETFVLDSFMIACKKYGEHIIGNSSMDIKRGVKLTQLVKRLQAVLDELTESL